MFWSDPICGKFAVSQAQRVITAAPNANMASSLDSIQRKSKSSSESPEKAFITSAEKGTNMAAMTRTSTDLKTGRYKLMELSLQKVISATVRPG